MPEPWVLVCQMDERDMRVHRGVDLTVLYDPVASCVPDYQGSQSSGIQPRPTWKLAGSMSEPEEPKDSLL